MGMPRYVEITGPKRSCPAINVVRCFAVVFLFFVHVRNISVEVKEIKLLKDISIQLKGGETAVLSGHNGSGFVE